MKPIPKPFPYSTAAESAKPGYLQRKFAAIRKQQEEERKATKEKVTPIAKPVVKAKV